ncbi:hypothetical protein [Fodinicurvata sp. EGI_FJ10296]|uniref:hypothetical protein n=1 Tax=Fodinicurvata sp. EGI_FJ10296 TaxID=3231908 RepID=UPI0034526586
MMSMAPLIGAQSAATVTRTTAIDFAPFLPVWLIAVFAILIAATSVYGLYRRAPGVMVRLGVCTVLILVLANPSLEREDRAAIADTAVILVDETPSQRYGARRERAEQAAAELQERLESEENLETRVVRVGLDGPASLEQTRLFDALDQAVADTPRRRIGSVFMVTDGQVHDVPSGVGTLDGIGPIHTLLTGERNEIDRRLTIVQAPSYGIVGQDASVTVRIDDLPEVGASGMARVDATVDGEHVVTRDLTVGQNYEMTFPLSHGGQTVIELEVAPIDDEITTANNRAAVVVNGVRDRLRVLLVSGEPHAGQRAWRNVLKSDPAVDLVHFTILRPPEKQDGTPINELSLISFPIRELFEISLFEFDLVIFDQYQRRGVLPSTYFHNIADYVRRGGAFLEASGPDFAQPFSIYRTPLGSILPGEPTGDIVERAFRPGLTEDGTRHPVTAGLSGVANGLNGSGEAADWGRWFRQIVVRPTAGATVMSGADNQPLMILDRVGEGRVAQLMSDQMWLWGRGYDGGGPQSEIIRRVAHWLMKEPELEENDLVATTNGATITVERRRLDGEEATVTLTSPSGQEARVDMTRTAPGRWQGQTAATEPGVYRVADNDETTLAVVGALNPPALRDVRTTEEKLAGIVSSTGGRFHWLEDGDMPAIRRVDAGAPTQGPGWMGVRRSGDYLVTGVSDIPLLPAVLVLLLLVGGLLAAWRREGQ